jgi:hypothetical protein
MEGAYLLVTLKLAAANGLRSELVDDCGRESKRVKHRRDMGEIYRGAAAGHTYVCRTAPRPRGRRRQGVIRLPPGLAPRGRPCLYYSDGMARHSHGCGGGSWCRALMGADDYRHYDSMMQCRGIAKTAAHARLAFRLVRWPPRGFCHVTFQEMDAS